MEQRKRYDNLDREITARDPWAEVPEFPNHGAFHFCAAARHPNVLSLPKL